MADEQKRSEPKEFLVVGLPEPAEQGSTLRLLGTAATQAAAEKLVASLDPGTVGRVAVVERKALFVRRPAVETVPLTESISKK